MIFRPVAGETKSGPPAPGEVRDLIALGLVTCWDLVELSGGDPHLKVRVRHPIGCATLRSVVELAAAEARQMGAKRVLLSIDRSPRPAPAKTSARGHDRRRAEILECCGVPRSEEAF